MLHLGTKKIYFGQKKPNSFKKAEIGFLTVKIFATCLFEIFFSKIILWTKTVLYKPFPLSNHTITEVLRPAEGLRYFTFDF